MVDVAALLVVKEVADGAVVARHGLAAVGARGAHGLTLVAQVADHFLHLARQVNCQTDAASDESSREGAGVHALLHEDSICGMFHLSVVCRKGGK